jgi:hypothetical protein
MSIITDPQRSFITSLVSARLSLLGFPDVTSATEALKLDVMSKEDASVIIGRLKGMPTDPDDAMPDVVANAVRKGTGNRPGQCQGCFHAVPAGAGYYYLGTDGRWNVHHKAGECSTAPAPTPVIVTEGIYVVEATEVPKIILVYRTGNNRLAGKVWTGGSYRYTQGAAAEAASGRPITWEEAQAFGVNTGRCIACALELTDGRSTERGYGPVCAKKYGWPWG